MASPSRSSFSLLVQTILKNCNVVTNKNNLIHVCTTYQKGKSHKLPFSKSNTMYTSTFELVMLDLWGSTFVKFGSNWYYISFFDVFSYMDFSHLTKILGD